MEDIGNKVLLHIGCGKRRHKGFINTDKKEMDITKTWPWGDESVDGIVSMQVLQQLTWRELLVVISEMKRVLKKGGVMRAGILLVETEEPLDWILGWNNTNLFSFDLLGRVFIDKFGFSSIRLCRYHDSAIPELTRADNRPDRGTFYLEVIK
jgi:ubiquinone/menaquinone biosynthesis C-methylase UbiE